MSGPRPHAAGFGPDELRAAVRAVLQDVLRDELAQGHNLPGGPSAEHVTVRDDAELDALVRRVATWCEDPGRRAELREGRHGLRLKDADLAARPSARPASAPGSAVVRIERGAVTERVVAQAAADRARLLVGPKAVLTPLARDKARVLGVEIEKER